MFVCDSLQVVASVTVRYLIVHDCPQAHDAHMHIILLAHETGVLDGFAAGDRAIAATDGRL